MRGDSDAFEKNWCQITERRKATQKPGKNQALYPAPLFHNHPLPPHLSSPPLLCPKPLFSQAHFSIKFLLQILSHNKPTASCLLTNGWPRQNQVFNISPSQYLFSAKCCESVKNSGDSGWKTRPFGAKSEISCWTNSTRKARSPLMKIAHSFCSSP